MVNKTCSMCKEEKSTDFFYPRRERNLNEFRSQCKSCCSIIQKQNKEKSRQYDKNHYQKNKEIVKQKKRDYRNNNLEKVLQTEKRSREKNKEKKLIYSVNYTRERRLTDDLFNFKSKVTRNILTKFKSKGIIKHSRTEEILGCSILFFKEYISSQFQKGMKLNNHGEWHLDHIIPISKATTEKEVIELCHYTNYQPLWKSDNLKKGNKILSKQLKLL